MEYLNFMFLNGWHFWGCLLLIIVAGGIITSIFRGTALLVLNIGNRK